MVALPSVVHVNSDIDLNRLRAGNSTSADSAEETVEKCLVCSCAVVFKLHILINASQLGLYTRTYLEIETYHFEREQ